MLIRLAMKVDGVSEPIGGKTTYDENERENENEREHEHEHEHEREHEREDECEASLWPRN